MRPEAMVPVEVPTGIGFASEQRLREHVIKHVLEGRDERWHRVLEPEALGNARDEWARDEFGEHCEALAREYQRIVGSGISEACCMGRWHHHVAEFAWIIVPPAYERVATTQTVEAWPVEHQLVVVAKAIVREERLRPYKIRTGLRKWPRLSGNAFIRAATHWAESRFHIRQRLSLGRHY